MNNNQLIIKVVIILVACSFTAPTNIQLENLYNNLTSTKGLKQFGDEFLQYLTNGVNIENIFNEIKQNTSNHSNPCMESMAKMNQQILFKAIDSSFKPAAGILSGNIYWLGNYRECMQTDGLHYCTMLDVVVAQKLPVVLGLCIPEECSADDAHTFLEHVSNLTTFGNFKVLQVYDNVAAQQAYGTDRICYSKETKYSAGAIIMIAITVTLALLCLLGSIVDGIKSHITLPSEAYKVITEHSNEELNSVNEMLKQSDEKVKHIDDNEISMHQVKVLSKDDEMFMMKFLLCFSLIKNTKAILNTDVPRGSITALNGMRTISITWVILGHSLAFLPPYIGNIKDIYPWARRFTMQAIVSGSLSVDSFFFLSGLLVGYLSLKRFQSKGSLPLVRYYVHRYIRLTPSYAFLIFFYTYLYPILTDGPNWYTQGPNSPATKNCEKYWWTNLLYINNFYPVDQAKGCFGWSWYLANDMQFYVISPIILYCMYKFKWLGVSITNGILLLACFIVNGVLIYHYKLSPLFADYHQNLEDPNSNKPTLDYFKYVYVVPYTRISPYLVGLVLGYILINKHVITGSYKNVMYLLGWAVAIASGMAVIYGPASQNDHLWVMAEYITYGMFFRFVWAVAIGWVIFACHNGKGGLVDSFLSWKAFIPLSRLTYAVYLVHPMVVWLFLASSITPLNVTMAFYIYFFIASTVISFMLAFVVAVCIEYPVFNLEKLVLKF